MMSLEATPALTTFSTPNKVFFFTFTVSLLAWYRVVCSVYNVDFIFGIIFGEFVAGSLHETNKHILDQFFVALCEGFKVKVSYPLR
jgi:hypothetical protein